MNSPAFVFDDVRIPPSRQIGMHSAPVWELSCVLYGAGTRTIGDLTEPIRQGEIILIPPEIPHVWRFDPAVTDADGNIANISVFFEPLILDSMLRLFPEMSATLEKIRSQTQAISYSGEAQSEIMELLLSMRGLSPEHRFPLMMKLLTAISDTSESRCAGRNNTLSRTAQRLEKVRVYCVCNYARPITLEEISAHVGMNKSAFCTFMRRHAGISLSEYVNALRLTRAMEKLSHSDSTIAEIALDCGFQNVTYFNRLFRTRYGRTPRAARSGRHTTQL